MPAQSQCASAANVAAAPCQPAAQPPLPGHGLPQLAVRVVCWREWRRPGVSLIGHADIALDGLIVHRVPIFGRSDGTLSAGVPTAPEVGPDGKQAEQGGKKLYRPAITFADPEARRHWSDGVVAALAAAGVRA